jgi:hypothetical protein
MNSVWYIPRQSAREMPMVVTSMLLQVCSGASWRVLCNDAQLVRGPGASSTGARLLRI